MPQSQYIMTIDAGRSNLHVAVYEYEVGNKQAPELVRNFPNVPNEDFVSARDGLKTERVAGVYGAVTGILAGLEPEFKRKMGMIVVDSHGAAAIVLDKNGNEFFTQIYDHDVSELRPAFDQICGPQDRLYLETSTPALPVGINWLTQIHYLLQKFPDEMRGAAHITSVAGYITSRLTGITGTDATHIGNHGYGLDYLTGELSSAIANLGTRYNTSIEKLIGDFSRPYRPISEVTEKTSKDFGLNPNCGVISVAHDSSLAAILAQIGDFQTMDSSGTWSVLMSPDKMVQVQTYMQQWDMTVNRDIFGKQLPTAMFRGGQMWKGYMELTGQTTDYSPQLDVNVLNKIFEHNLRVRPAFMDGVGPYKHSKKAPILLEDVRKDSVQLAHMVQLALAIQTAFSEAASGGDLKEDTSILEILADRRHEKILVAGPYTQGLAKDILNLVLPREMYIVDDKNPVNLAGAVVGAAALEGASPDQLEIEGLPFRQVPIKHAELRPKMIEYAQKWEKWVRDLPLND